MALPLSGRVALITGGASGIGAATVTALADLGADIAVFDRSLPPSGLPGEPVDRPRITRYELDLGQEERIALAVQEVLAAFGRIDILVNCAAINGKPAPTAGLELTAAVWREIFAVNVTAPLLLMQEVARHMIRRGHGGRIVNVTSSSAHRAESPPAYASSKAALTQLTRSMAAELAEHDINVNNVAPGATRTPFGGVDDAILEERVRTGPTANLLRRVSEPRDVAAAIVFLCLPESRQITAQTIHTSGGLVV